MPKFRPKTPTVIAVTFAELVAHGIASGAPLHNGVPWSFEFEGHAITHETDEKYIVGGPIDGCTYITPNDVLVIWPGHSATVMYACVFEAEYQPDVEERYLRALESIATGDCVGETSHTKLQIVRGIAKEALGR